MSFFGTIKRELRGAPDASDDFWYNPIGFTSNTGVKVSQQSSMQLVAVWACVRLLSAALATVPAILYRSLGEKGKERAREHPHYRLFTVAFTPELTAFRGFEAMMSHVLTWGNAYAFKELDRNKRVKWLHPIRPDVISPRRAEEGERIGSDRRASKPRELVYDFGLGHDPKVYGRDEIFHVPGMGFDGVKGYNPIEFAADAIGLGLATQESGARFYKDGMSPSGIVEYPTRMKNPDRFKAEVQETFGGLGNRHKLMVLEEGLKFHPVGIPQETAQYIETRNFSVVEIARFFGVQPHKIGQLDKATFSNIEEQSLEFLSDTMLPWFTRWEQEAALQILDSQDVFLEFLAENTLKMNAKAKADLFKALFDLASITPNEIRSKMNMNPYEGGDEFYRQLNMAPVSEPLPASDAAKKLADNLKQRSERRTASSRLRLQRNHLPQLEATFQRVVNAEVREVRKAVDAVLGRRDAADFRAWLRRFYNEHGTAVESAILPAYRAYIASIRSAAAGEVDLDPDTEFDFVADFAAGYVGIYVVKHVGSSRRQLEKLLEGTQEEAINAVSARLDEWVEKRAGKIAADEAVNVDGVVTRATYRQAGVTRIVWVANGSDVCPFCSELDGKVVGLDQPFLMAGSEFNPPGASSPLKSRKTVLNPPIHGGCTCQISPG